VEENGIKNRNRFKLNLTRNKTREDTEKINERKRKIMPYPSTMQRIEIMPLE
jgi:hypothetical protein